VYVCVCSQAYSLNVAQIRGQSLNRDALYVLGIYNSEVERCAWLQTMVIKIKLIMYIIIKI